MAPGALAGLGYQLDSVAPSIPTTDEVPIGVAIDQSSQLIYVAVNPVTHGIYAYPVEGSTPFGQKGEPKLSTFSSSPLPRSPKPAAKTQAEVREGQEAQRQALGDRNSIHPPLTSVGVWGKQEGREAWLRC